MYNMPHSTTAQLFDIMADREHEKPLDKLCIAEYLEEVVRRAINPVERHVVLEWFYRGRTLEEISSDKELTKNVKFQGIKNPKVSRQRVEKIKKNAVTKISLCILNDRHKEYPELNNILEIRTKNTSLKKRPKKYKAKRLVLSVTQLGLF